MGAPARNLLSSPLVLWVLLFNIIGFFTWGFGPLTFCCLLLVVYLLFALQKGRQARLGRLALFPASGRADVSVGLRNSLYLLVLLAAAGAVIGLFVAPDDWLIDIGLNTYLACESIAKGLNPYANRAQAWHTIDENHPNVQIVDGQVLLFGVPYYYGFPYFPAMFLSYLPFTLLLERYDAVRLLNVLLMGANLIGIRMLVARLSRLHIERSQMVAIVAYLSIGVYWFEIFWLGIVDILLSTFILYAFLCLSNRQFVLGGVCLGLAQAAKLLPPPFLALGIVLLLLGREGFWRFLLAYTATGLAFILPFLLWDPQAFVSATILFYLTAHNMGDNTALWFFLPQFLQGPFLLLGYLAAIGTLIVFVRRGGTHLVDVMAGGFSCYLIFTAFSKMTHLNYLWAVYPLGCVALALLLERLPAPAGAVKASRV